MNLITALKTYPLREAMRLYESKLGNTYPMEDIQIDDWEMASNEIECCFLRSRGGSKTKDFTDWIIFRVLRTGERWAWLSSKSGQLDQAMIYVRENPFVQRVQRLANGKYNVILWNACIIRFGIISTSNLGLRVDGIVYDEEQENKGIQRTETYPQMAGMLTASVIHKQVHLGTRWINTLLDEHIETYPTSIRDWEQCPWLVKAGFIAKEISDGFTPDWEIDLLYRCIATAPGGMFFPSIILEDLSDHKITNEMLYGIDYGATDHIVGVEIAGVDCYLLEEYEVDIETHPSCVDFMKGQKVESEGGGYNVDARYSAKGLLVQQRVASSLVAVTQKWKDQRKMYGRRLRIHMDKNRTPGTTKDVKGATFGPDGYYLKNTANPCHWLDAFLHAIMANTTSYLSSAYKSKRNNILKAEAKRAARSTYR